MISALILEDDPGKLGQIVAVIIRTGASNHEMIDTAPDALTGRRLLREKAYDLFVLDLAVPERLGEAPDPTAGSRLLEDLLEGEGLKMPGQIIGLTGFEELAVEFAAGFAARGILLVRYVSSSDVWQAPLVMQVRQITARKRAEATGNDYSTHLGIVCALDVELDAVEHLPWDWHETEVPGDPTYYLRGSIPGSAGTRAAVAALCPRMGMSAASITATKLIAAFRPRYLVMPGVTAAIRGSANLGDVIVADEVWDWGMGKWTRRDGQVVFVPGPHHISLDATMRSQLVRIARNEEFLARTRADWPAPKPDAPPRLLFGPVASGAAVIAAQEMADHIAAQHRKLVGIEMEAYGVYAAAMEASVPRPTVVAVKAASDFGTNRKVTSCARTQLT